MKDTFANQLTPSNEEKIKEATELANLKSRVESLKEDKTRLEGALREERKRGEEALRAMKEDWKEERRRAEEALREMKEEWKEERKRSDAKEKTYRWERYASGGSGRSVSGA